MVLNDNTKRRQLIKKIWTENSQLTSEIQKKERNERYERYKRRHENKYELLENSLKEEEEEEDSSSDNYVDVLEYYGNNSDWETNSNEDFEIEEDVEEWNKLPDWSNFEESEENKVMSECQECGLKCTKFEIGKEDVNQCQRCLHPIQQHMKEDDSNNKDDKEYGCQDCVLYCRDFIYKDKSEESDDSENMKCKFCNHPFDNHITPDNPPTFSSLTNIGSFSRLFNSRTNWDKLCSKLDIDQRFFKLITTQSNGNCLFHSLSIALDKELEKVIEKEEITTSDKIKFLREMVADTILDEENQEATNVLTTWNMLYKMAKEEKDYEMMRHYEHLKCLVDIPDDEILLPENRKKVFDEMMKKDFWGEEYSLQIFERELNIKIILLNSDKQKVEQTNNNFDAKDIVLLYYSGNHYQIVSYKNEYLFNIMGDLGDIEELLSNNGINIYKE